MDSFIRNMNRQARKAEMKDYLLKEQGWEDEHVNKMSYDELEEAWDHYHEECW